MESILHGLGVDPGALILQIVGFFLLFLVLKRYVFGEIGTVIENRRRMIRDRMAKLEADQKELDRLQEEVRQRLTEIELEARSRINAAVEEANAARERIMEQASRDAEGELANARQMIRREKDRAVAELRGQVGDIAMLIAERVLNASLDAARHRQVIDDFIDQLPSSKAN